VAGANTEFKKLLLKGLFYDAQNRALELEKALRLAVSGQYNSTASGLVIVATAGNGQSVQFALPESKYTPFEIAIAVSQLDDLFDDAKSELITDGIASPSDDQIFVRMKELLRPRNSCGVDYSRMSQVGDRS
jgi:hypothetical protein